MLWCGGMRAWQAGQWLGGTTTDISRGQRWMATLKKLPHSAPKTNAMGRMSHGERAAAVSIGMRA